MGFDYVFSTRETVAILIGIAIIIVLVAVFVLREDTRKDGEITITEMKEPKIRP